MNNRKLVSIIVPVYNSEKYLNKCIQSLEEQSLSAIEIVLVDDGSTDLSGQLCDEFALKDSRVKVIHQDNKGQVSAKKVGVLQAQGEYVGFVDSDDWVDKEYYEKVYSIMEKTNVDLVSSGIVFEWEDGTKDYKYDIGREVVYSTEYEKKNFYEDMLLPSGDEYKIIPTHCTKLFRRNILIEVMENIDDMIRWHEDDCLVYSYISRCKSFTFLHRAYYHYIQHPEACHMKKDALYFARANYLRLSMLQNFLKSEYYEIFRGQLDVYFVKMLEEGISFFGDLCTAAKGSRIILGDFIKECKNVGIYGVGKSGKRIIDYLIDNTEISIVALFDRNLSGGEYRNINIYCPEEISNFELDHILVTIKDYNEYRKIQKYLCSLGIPGYMIEHVST